MLQLEPHIQVIDGSADLSLNEPDGWGFPEGMGVVHGTYAHLGDEDRGPIVFLFDVPPDVPMHESPAHGHASDNWRMSMRGVLPMGPDRYGPGQFRFNKGWKPYGSDAMSSGPDGGWAVLVFGDKRGTKIRPVKPGAEGFPDERGICEWAHLAGDQVSDDPVDGAGPAGLVLSNEDLTAAYRNGDFADGGSWPEVLPGVRAVVSLLGDPVCGPVLELAHIDAGVEAMPATPFETEVLRLVVAGSCTIGDRTYGPGDARVQDVTTEHPAVVAGPDGLAEAVLYGDRRGVVGGPSDSPWAEAHARLLEDLGKKVMSVD